jgi:hypothetical protein
MKKLVKYFLRIFVLAVLGVGLFKSYKLCQQHTLKEGGLSLQKALPEKSFVIVVFASNPGFSCEKNIFSLLTQQYQNYRVIYLDSHSTDGSLAKVEETAKHLGKQDKISILCAQGEEKDALEIFYDAMKKCFPREIVLLLPATDFLAHEHVLSKLNRIYSNPFVWMTYGNFLDYPSYKQTPLRCKQIPKSAIGNNSYRSLNANFLHPISFYAGLFQQIRSEDLSYEENLSYVFPLLEMSGKHARFISDVLSLHKPIFANKKESFQSPALNKKQAKYQRLKALFLTDSASE